MVTRYRALAVASFTAEEPTELSCSAHDVLFVSGDRTAPAGWLLGSHSSDPSTTGLLPASHLLGEDTAVTAPCDFDGVVIGDLAFKKGDVLLVCFSDFCVLC